MAENRGSGVNNLGITSIVLIFTVLCLTVFAVLSISNAAGDRALAVLNADMVQAYYDADCRGEEWFAETCAQIADIRAESKDDSDFLESVSRAFELEYDENIGCRIVVDDVRSLYIEITAGTLAEPPRVLRWVIVSEGEYVIDDSMPVWSGEPLD